MTKRICTNCGMENDTDAKFCKACQSTILFDETEAFGSEQEAAADQKRSTSPAAETKCTENMGKQIEETILDNPEAPSDENMNIYVKKKKRRWIIPIVIIVIALIVIFVMIPSGPKVASISAKYTGDTAAGVVLDNHNTGIVVTGRTEDNQSIELSGWNIAEPATLEADSSSKVEITYRDLTCTLTVNCSTSEVVAIEASYDGDASAGVILDDTSPITVQEVFKNGSRSEAEEWHVATPVTLEADSSADVEIQSGDFSTTLTVECSTSTVTALEAVYDGETEEGTVLDTGNTGIHVTATYKNGTQKEVTNYTIAESKTLTAGETSAIIIQYEGMECELSVECTTLSPEQFKAMCESIPYENLARNPDEYKSKEVKFTGEVVQTMESGNLGALRVNVTKGKYYYSDTVYVMYEVDSSNRILEDDIVTFYGYSMGLYTYKTVMGASVTIPEVLALYVDVE